MYGTLHDTYSSGDLCPLMMYEWICHPPETYKEQIYKCLLEMLNTTLQLLKLNWARSWWFSDFHSQNDSLEIKQRHESAKRGYRGILSEARETRRGEK